MRFDIWGWKNPNCWAGVVGAFIAAGLRLVLHGLAPSEASGLAAIDWMPDEVTILVAAVLGGASGLTGAMLVDLLTPTDG
jgi:hypothetical protein